LNARVGSANIKNDPVPDVIGFVDDAAFRNDKRADKRGAHGMQKSISVGAVDRSGVLGVKRYRLADFIEREIGRVRFTIDFELGKHSSVLSR